MNQTAARILKPVRETFCLDPYQLDDANTHKTYLVLALVFLILPAFLSFVPQDDRSVTLFSKDLPSFCLTHSLFGVQCPGCGLTRSFVLLTHGRLREALGFHRVGPILYLYFLYQVFYRIYALRRLPGPLPKKLMLFQHYLALVIIGLLILNWTVGLFLGGNGF